MGAICCIELDADSEDALDGDIIALGFEELLDAIEWFVLVREMPEFAGCFCFWGCGGGICCRCTCIREVDEGTIDVVSDRCPP